MTTRNHILFGSTFITLLTLLFIPPAHAQMGDYEVMPQMRSYLQRPATETGQYSGNISVPQITEQQQTGRMAEVLPEMTPFEMPDMYEILIDKKIDPTQYIVGPGDLFSVYFWGELDKQYQGRVIPEGHLIIPTVGTVMVSDMTLEEAKERITEAVNRNYTGIEVSINLMYPRRFRVYVSGVVENPGMYEANALTRVSDLFAEIEPGSVEPEVLNTNVQQTRQQSNQQQSILQVIPLAIREGEKAGLFVRDEENGREGKRGSSKRLIKLYHDDEVIEVDLLKFEKMGDLDMNPYVSGGIEIAVPPYNGDIIASGEVNEPGYYEYKKGDRIADLVTFGGGLTTLADTSSANLVRFTNEGREIETMEINLHDALFTDPDNPRYLLQESDRLFVKTKYDYKVVANVTVDGEVRYPGEYAITPGVTRLSDVIEMAGGFTDEANLQEARITKPVTSAIRDLEYERLRNMPVEDMTEEEYEYYKLSSRMFQNVYTIDFVQLFENNDTSQDIFLEEDDQIFIPMERELVKIMGAVMTPGFVRQEAGGDVEYYIEKAGGFNWNAKTRSVRIIKARTGQRFKPDSDVAIEGGDTVMIPEKEPFDYWQFFQESMAVFADVATLLIIAQNLIDSN